jgi:hypothetical protein
MWWRRCCRNFEIFTARTNRTTFWVVIDSAFFCHTLISWGGCGDTGEMTEFFLVTRQNFNSRRMTQAVLHHCSVTATSFATLIHECKLWIPKTATAPQKAPAKAG